MSPEHGTGRQTLAKLQNTALITEHSTGYHTQSVTQNLTHRHDYRAWHKTPHEGTSAECGTDLRAHEDEAKHVHSPNQRIEDEAVPALVGFIVQSVHCIPSQQRIQHIAEVSDGISVMLFGFSGIVIPCKAPRGFIKQCNIHNCSISSSLMCMGHQRSPTCNRDEVTVDADLRHRQTNTARQTGTPVTSWVGQICVGSNPPALSSNLGRGMPLDQSMDTFIALVTFQNSMAQPMPELKSTTVLVSLSRRYRKMISCITAGNFQ